MTYNQLAEALAETLSKGSNSSFLYSRSYTAMGCFIYIDPNSMVSSKGPMVKVIQIINGNRLETKE